MNHVDKAAYHLALASDELMAANRNSSPLEHLLIVDLLEQAAKLMRRTQAVANAMGVLPDEAPAEERE
jgi:hypothetical protein